MSAPAMTQPHSLDAERGVLGAILIDNEALEHAQGALGPTVEEHPNAFFRDAHRRIYRAIVDLGRRRQPVDLLTLKVALEAAGELDECGGPVYLASLVDGVPRATNVEAYAGIVREKWARRQLIAASNKLARLAYTDEDCTSADLMEQAEKEMLELSRQQVGRDGGLAPAVWMGNTIAVIQERYENRKYITGLATGIVKLDYLLRGLQRGDFIILAARPSMGKTALVLQMALYMATQGWVLFFSLEMTERQLGIRAVAVQAGVNTYALLTGHIRQEDHAKIADAANTIAQSSIIIDDTAGLSPHLIRSLARRHAAQKGNLVAVVVDYIGLIDTSGMRVENRQLAVAQVSRQLKELAKELDIPVLAISQLSRAPENRSDKRPQLSDLRESGALEQDADVVLLLHRPEYYEKEPKEPGLTELYVPKQRNGSTGMVKLKFVKEETRFERWPDSEGSS